MQSQPTSWWHVSITEPGGAAPDRSRQTLARGILFFRWVWLTWMIVLAATGNTTFRRPVLAWVTVGLTTAWTIWLSVTRKQWTRGALLLDLALAAWLILASGLVVDTGAVVSGRPFFATGYPLSAALMWGAAGGPSAGILAGGVLGVAQLLTRPLNGVALASLTGSQIQNMTGALVNYIVAGSAIGLVSRLLVRSGQAVDQANAELVSERERAARLAERESLARQIHDSVLQALAYVHKRGSELAARADVPPAEVAALATMAGEQEAELRNLISREPEEAPTGFASLRAALEGAARSSSAKNVTVSSVGPIWLERATVDEVAAAVRQALENVARHARATKASVFAEQENGTVTVSVRDDGVGFAFDEESLKASGKVGILKSIKGRVEEVGGEMTITSAPGAGTEIEFVLPQRPRP
jgi:signal transduction histidine kinase